MLFITIKENFYYPVIALGTITLAVHRLKGLLFIFGIAVTIGLTDAISHNIIKEVIARPRPCNTLPDLINVINCSNSFSFPSNHAGNIFAAAMFSTLCFRVTALPVFGFALLVCYSRVYLKVHYPFDVLAGMIFGGLMGYLGHRYIYSYFLKFVKKPEPKIS